MLLPLSGIVGVVIVLGSDVLLRAVIGGQAGVDIPTGVVTTLVGAAILVWLARRHRDAGPTRASARRARGRPLPPPSHRGVVAVTAVLTVCAVAVGMLAGDTWVLLGDVVNWVNGTTGPAYTFVLDQRWPRVAAAVLAGAALAVAGTHSAGGLPQSAGRTRHPRHHRRRRARRRAPAHLRAAGRGVGRLRRRRGSARCWRSPWSTAWPGAAG